MHRLLCIFILSISAATVSAQALETVYEWNYIDYLWVSDDQREEAVTTGAYDLSRIIPTDVDKAPDGRVFLSFIGSWGVPARLGVVSEIMLPESGPVIVPYPSWDWHNLNADCSQRITSVYGMAVDRYNNRLWVLDTGILDGSLENNCNPQLLVFDLGNDQLVQRIEVPYHIGYSNNGVSLLANLVISVNGQNYDSTTVYISDTYGCGLIVMYPDGSFVRHEGDYFDPKPEAEYVTVGGYTKSMPACVWGMAVSPVTYSGEPQYLHFRPFSSFDLYRVNTDWFQPGYSLDGYVDSVGPPGILSSQATRQAFASQGTLFMGMTSEMGITCWNRYKPMTPENIQLVAQDGEELRYPNGLKVIPPSAYQDSEELWVLSNRYMEFRLGALDVDDVNFRVLKSDVEDLIDDTVCEEPSQEVTVILYEADDEADDEDDDGDDDEDDEPESY